MQVKLIDAHLNDTISVDEMGNGDIGVITWGSFDRNRCIVQKMHCGDLKILQVLGKPCGGADSWMWHSYEPYPNFRIRLLKPGEKLEIV